MPWPGSRQSQAVQSDFRRYCGMKLKGRTAIITGASQGLGAAIAERFAAEGASLALCSRHQAEIEAKCHELLSLHPKAKIHAQAADVASEDQVDSFFAVAERELG